MSSSSSSLSPKPSLPPRIGTLLPIRRDSTGPRLGAHHKSEPSSSLLDSSARGSTLLVDTQLPPQTTSHAVFSSVAESPVREAETSLPSPIVAPAPLNEIPASRPQETPTQIPLILEQEFERHSDHVDSPTAVIKTPEVTAREVQEPSEPEPSTSHATTHPARPEVILNNRPLSEDVTNRRSHGDRNTFSSRLGDLFVSTVCLGIPYLFIRRANLLRITDEESMSRSAGPMLAIEVLTSLSAVMILTASAIKLSQPGLSNLERFLGSAAIICSTASIISTAIAHFHSEADVERTVVYVDGESPEMLLMRSVVMFLPQIFLSFALVIELTILY